MGKTKLKQAAAKKPAPQRVAKPKSTRVTTPAPPAPPPPPAQREELAAPRDVARLLRYGEKFGAQKIDVKWLTTALPVSSGAIAIGDPGVPKSWRILDRPVGTGMFRAMTSIGSDGRNDGAKQRLAAVVVHVGRPPIARWTVAHFKGQKPPKSPDDLPRVSVTTGWIALVDPTAPLSGGAAGAGRARTVDPTAPLSGGAAGAGRARTVDPTAPLSGGAAGAGRARTVDPTAPLSGGAAGAGRARTVDPTAPLSGGAAGAGRARTVDTGAATGVLAVPAVAGLDPIEIPLTDGRRALALAAGNGEYTAYWAVDADDKAIALVIDFDTFSKKDWKTASV